MADSTPQKAPAPKENGSGEPKRQGCPPAGGGLCCHEGPDGFRCIRRPHAGLHMALNGKGRHLVWEEEHSSDGDQLLGVAAAVDGGVAGHRDAETLREIAGRL